MWMTFIFVLTLIIGVPVIAVIGLATLASILIDGTVPTTVLSQALYTGVNQYPLIAVAGFIFAGALFGHAGVTERIVEVASALVGRITGALAVVAIAASMFFSSITGSGPATVAAVGGLLIPAMMRHGMTASFSAAVVAAGGTLGILIPPSNPMIIYGVIGNVSVTRLFMAGLLPGLMVGGLLMLMAVMVCRLGGMTAPAGHFSWSRLGRALNRGKWALASPLLILGGIYGGVFTPVEASVVAVFYALGVGVFIHRELTFMGFIKALRDTAVTTGTVVVIVGVALAFGRVITIYQVPTTVANALLTISSDPLILLFMIVLFLIIIGTFMETLAQIVILVPVFLPVVAKLGVDPIHFGVIFIVCCEIGFLTPPLGANLYIAAKQANISLDRIIVAVLPFLAVLLLSVVLIVVFPSISLFLPRLLMGN